MNDPHFYMVYSDVSNDNTLCLYFSVKDTGQKSVPTMIGSTKTRVERLAQKLLLALRQNRTDDIERLALTMSRSMSNGHVAVLYDSDDRVVTIGAVANDQLEDFEQGSKAHADWMVAKYGERAA